MKYSVQLLYIVLAIYLTFVAWSVDANTAVSQYFNLGYMTYIHFLQCRRYCLANNGPCDIKRPNKLSMLTIM